MPISTDSVLTLLSKSIGDYWAGTTTSAGLAGGTTLVDTALMSQANDWISKTTWVRITSGACDGEERKVTSLDITTGTLTILATSAQILGSVTYELHRLFTPTEKKLALQMGAFRGFPWINQPIKDDYFRTGNWLKNGSFENWAVATAPDHWTRSAVTCTKISTARLFMSGSYALLMSGAAGYVGQSWADNDDLKHLRGRTVTIRSRGWSDTASSLRIGVYDGVTTTYSDYAENSSGWDDSASTWYFYAPISSEATEVTIRLYHDNAAASDRVDDIRLLSGFYNKVDISDLALAQDQPIQVDFCLGNPMEDDWIPVRRYDLSPTERVIYLVEGVPNDALLRVEGVGYLDFLVSGAPSDSWTATVNINYPQTEILIAEAALVLYQQKSLPNDTVGDRAGYQSMIPWWQDQLKQRRAQYGMHIPSPRIRWTV